MKKMRNIILLALLLLKLSSCADDHLTLTGTITALPEDCRLVLMNYDQDCTIDSIPTYADIDATEHFTMNAFLDGPTLLRLVVTRYNQSYDRQAPVAAVSFMADNEKVNIPTISFSDLVKYTDDETAEENIVIKGGRSQKEYKEYIDSIQPIKTALAATWNEGGEKIMDAKFGLVGEDNDSVKMFTERLETLQRKMNAKTQEFISLHPDYAISALLVSRELNTTYKYSAEEIDSLVALIADNPDRHRVATARQNAEKAKLHALGRPLGNEEITMADCTKRRLHDLLNDKGLTLIDCWASWCGPCRMAIPRLKAMSVKYADRLEIVSISCDRREADWRKAMAEEGMTWQQAIVMGEQLEPFLTAYDITTIPRLILVADGKILFAGSDPTEIETRVAAYYSK